MSIASFRVRSAPHVQRCTLEVPPTANKRLVPGIRDGKPTLYTRKSTKLYKKICDLPTCGLRPVLPPAEVEIWITWYRSSPRDGDTDNRVKQALDVLQGRAYLNDAQVRRHHVERNDSEPTRPRLRITIEDLSQRLTPVVFNPHPEGVTRK